jgi:hypothetical protein
MNVQDFFAIVQLGVGIHAGTAILQLSGELGVAPVERRIDALEAWIRQEKERGFELEDNSERLALIRVDLIVFRARYDRLYTNSVRMTFAFGSLITLMLAVMSFFAQTEISACVGVFIVSVSVFPAIAIFVRLWRISSKALDPIKAKITSVENAIRSPDA